MSDQQQAPAQQQGNDAQAAAAQQQAPAQQQDGNKPAGKTIGEGGAPQGQQDAGKGAPAADWATLRSDWAGGDEATSKVLDRYSDGKAFVKAHKELVDKLASGELKTAKKLPENPTPEQIADYRKANGIPEKPDGYDIQFPVGFTPDEATKATLEEYRAFAHANHIPPNLVKGQVNWYLAAQQKAAEARLVQDDKDQSDGAELLRKDWGHEFGRNIQTVQALFEGNEELFGAIMGARGADGKKLGNNPDVLRFLVNVGVNANPSIREYAGDGSVTPASAAERIKEIEDLRIKDWSKYRSPAIQEEYSRLLSYMEARGQKVA